MFALPTTSTSSFGAPKRTPARRSQLFRSFGAPLDGLDLTDLLDDEENLRFGIGDDHIDILASIGEMSFDQVWRNRVETQVRGLSIPFISKLDLIENKVQTGRHRDLADAEELSRLP